MADLAASPAPSPALYLRGPRSVSACGSPAVVGPPDAALLRDVVGYEYRSMVIRQLQTTVEWETLEWLDFAACRKTGTATRELCRRCTVRAPCLAAAIVLDDPADWRGGIHCDERADLWAQFESAFLALRDHDLMQLDRLVDGRGAI